MSSPPPGMQAAQPDTQATALDAGNAAQQPQLNDEVCLIRIRNMAGDPAVPAFRSKMSATIREVTLRLSGKMGHEPYALQLIGEREGPGGLSKTKSNNGDASDLQVTDVGDSDTGSEEDTGDSDDIAINNKDINDTEHCDLSMSEWSNPLTISEADDHASSSVFLLENTVRGPHNKAKAPDLQTLSDLEEKGLHFERERNLKPTGPASPDSSEKISSVSEPISGTSGDRQNVNDSIIDTKSPQSPRHQQVEPDLVLELQLVVIPEETWSGKVRFRSLGDYYRSRDRDRYGWYELKHRSWIWCLLMACDVGYEDSDDDPDSDDIAGFCGDDSDESQYAPYYATEKDDEQEKADLKADESLSARDKGLRRWKRKARKRSVLMQRIWDLCQHRLVGMRFRGAAERGKGDHELLALSVGRDRKIDEGLCFADCFAAGKTDSNNGSNSSSDALGGTKLTTNSNMGGNTINSGMHQHTGGSSAEGVKLGDELDAASFSPLLSRYDVQAGPSAELLHELNSQIDELRENEPVDYHPGSERRVRDLVHPGLYCYVEGVTKLKSPSGEEAAKAAEWEYEDFFGREYEASKFQWLPSEFRVDHPGDAPGASHAAVCTTHASHSCHSSMSSSSSSPYARVSIVSPINNLDRDKYPGLYNSLAGLFECALPMLEHTWFQYLGESGEYESIAGVRNMAGQLCKNVEEPNGRPVYEETDTDVPDEWYAEACEARAERRRVESVENEGDAVEVTRGSKAADDEVKKSEREGKEYEGDGTRREGDTEKIHNSEKEEKEEETEKTQERKEGHEEEEENHETSDFARDSLRNRTLQVITKIVDYEIRPNDVHEGVWHLEGMSHENIVATVLCIVDKDDDLVGGDLLFMRAVTTQENSRLISWRHWADSMNAVGKVLLPNGRMLIFPNSHVHKVTKLWDALGHSAAAAGGDQSATYHYGEVAAAAGDHYRDRDEEDERLEAIGTIAEEATASHADQYRQGYRLPRNLTFRSVQAAPHRGVLARESG